LADLYRRKEAYAEAAAVYRRALVKEPGDIDLLLGLASVLLADREPGEALDLCDRALAVNPGFASAHTVKGKAHHEQGEYGKALTEYRRAIELDSRQTVAYRASAQIHVDELRDMDAHISQYEAVRAASPEEVRVLGLLAYSYQEQDRLEEAIEAFEAILKLDPEYVDAHYELATLYERAGLRQPAIDHWNLCAALAAKAQQAAHAWRQSDDLIHVVILSPVDGARLAGRVDIRGSAMTQDLLRRVPMCRSEGRCAFPLAEVSQAYYKVEYRSADDPTGWMLIGDLRYEPVLDGLLATWDTDGLAEGSYVIRLLVVDSTGNSRPPFLASVEIDR
jgi:tetratricopeptide (TPR) repeat protein